MYHFYLQSTLPSVTVYGGVEIALLQKKKIRLNEVK